MPQSEKTSTSQYEQQEHFGTSTAGLWCCPSQMLERALSNVVTTAAKRFYRHIRRDPSPFLVPYPHLVGCQAETTRHNAQPLDIFGPLVRLRECHRRHLAAPNHLAFHSTTLPPLAGKDRQLLQSAWASAAADIWSGLIPTSSAGNAETSWYSNGQITLKLFHRHLSAKLLFGTSGHYPDPTS